LGKTRRSKLPIKRAKRASKAAKTDEKQLTLALMSEAAEFQKKAPRADLIEPIVEEPEPKAKPKRRATAESMASRQQEISISEFFAKNRHLLGFDNPRKALLTTVKEAVDNSLDACEEAGILPDLRVEIQQVSESRYTVAIQDNGPGIVRKQIPNIFGKLLYGSKFHRLKMSRGQQGIGISAAGMYGLLTTGQSVKITSRTSKGRPARYYELQIDTKKNRPDIIVDQEVEWENGHGTRVEIQLEAKFVRGKQSVDAYLEQTAMANPHVDLAYVAPDGAAQHWERAATDLPREPKEIKPHPYGVELGVLLKMLRDGRQRTLKAFLTQDFSRVSSRIADQICETAGLSTKTSPKRIARHEVDQLYEAIQKTRIMAPSTNCIVPIGEDLLQKGVEHVITGEFYTATTRPPSVYRGNPFQIEAALAFGKPVTDVEQLKIEKKSGKGSNGHSADELMRVVRFANRVPLLYQQGACAVTRSVMSVNWRNYGLSQARGALPAGPIVLLVHVASVWVPFTSESKEAVAHYPEILKEIRLAVQDCGRKLGIFLRRRKREAEALRKRSYIEKYLPHIGIGLREVLGFSQAEQDRTIEKLKIILERSRG